MASHASGDPRPSSLELYEIADRLAQDTEDAAELRHVGRGKQAAISRRCRRLNDIDQARRDAILWLGLSGWAEERDEDETPQSHQRRLRRIHQERPRKERALERLDPEWLALSLASGARGPRVVTGIMQVGAGAAFSALAFANVFIVAIVGMFLLGAVYAGLTPTLAPPIEFWIGVTTSGLAIAYVQLVKMDVDIQLAPRSAGHRGAEHAMGAEPARPNASLARPGESIAD